MYGLNEDNPAKVNLPPPPPDTHFSLAPRDNLAYSCRWRLWILNVQDNKPRKIWMQDLLSRAIREIMNKILFKR